MSSSLGEGLSFASFDILVVSDTPTHPQDQDDRKRIFEICAEFKRRGARIAFVHYATESDWRRRWPKAIEAEMRATWEDYHFVAPSRPLRDDSENADHGIDAWVDVGLRGFVEWACRARAYDAAIVNGAGLSFCLEAAPKDVFKICDAQVLLSDRGDAGQDPRLFTTKAEEARGLERADLVWAAKPSDEAYLRDELSVRHCVTMLPAEPERGWWRQPPSQDGWLRAGVIGADSSLDRRNVEAFLKVALQLIESYMAPVKIVLAGALGEAFRSWAHPNLELWGAAESPETFYARVDVVAAPIKTGAALKVRTAEAFAAGAPLVALAHATEGFPTKEPLHKLHTFEDMAVELARLSFDRAPLAALAGKSQTVCRAVCASVSRSFDETQRRLVARLASTLCFVVPAEAFNPSNLLHDHFLAAIDYLRHASPVAIFARGPAPKAMSFDFFDRSGLRPQVFAEPELVRALGDGAPDFWRPIALAKLLEVRGISRLYLMTDGGDEMLYSPQRLREAYVRCDVVEAAGGDVMRIVGALNYVPKLVLIGANAASAMRWTQAAGGADIVDVPFCRNGDFAGYRRQEGGHDALLVLSHGDNPVANGLLRLSARLGWRGTILDPGDQSVKNALLGRGEPGENAWSWLSEARLLVNLMSDHPLAEIVGELAIRTGVPRLTLLSGQSAVGSRLFENPLRPASVARLYSTVAECVTNPTSLEALRTVTDQEALSRYKNDAGWALLWAPPQD